MPGPAGGPGGGAVMPLGGGRFWGGGPRGLTGTLERQVRGTTPFWLRSIRVHRACGVVSKRSNGTEECERLTHPSSYS